MTSALTALVTVTDIVVQARNTEPRRWKELQTQLTQPFDEPQTRQWRHLGQHQVDLSEEYLTLSGKQ